MCKEKLTTPDEMLYRQVNPNWMRGGVVTKQLFFPTPKDQGQLSLDRSSKTVPSNSPKWSYDLYTSRLNPQTGENLKSEGIYGITVAECNTVALPEQGITGFEVIDDPRSDIDPPNPAHVFIDFCSFINELDKAVEERKISKTRRKERIEEAADKLTLLAKARGWLLNKPEDISDRINT